LPLSVDAASEGVKRYIILHTHWHHDHTQGMPIAGPIFDTSVPMEIFGPVEQGIGPKQVYESIMNPPWHPVALGKLSHHIRFRPLDLPTTRVIVFHPEGGLKILQLCEYRRLVAEGKHLPFRSGVGFSEKECLVVFMSYTEHPERTISYRFQERGEKTFIFLTDEECRAAIPADLGRFLRGADLLIQDAQYTDVQFQNGKAGFGHGTPAYALKVAQVAGVKRLGLTHHDPSSSDEDVDANVEEGRKLAAGTGIEVFGCADYQEIEV